MEVEAGPAGHDGPMGTYALTKGKDGRYAADGLGAFRQRTWRSPDTDAEPVGDGPVRFTRTIWGRTYTATTETGAELGRHDRTTVMRCSGPIRWSGVDYEFARTHNWKNVFTLSRYGEPLATFSPARFGGTILVTTSDTATVPPGLLLFCAWITLVTVRDGGAAAG